MGPYDVNGLEAGAAQKKGRSLHSQETTVTVYYGHRIAKADTRTPIGAPVQLSGSALDEYLDYKINDEGSRPLSLDDWYKGNVAVGERSFFVLTFDDGYKDNLINLLPILERHVVPATIFVTTGFIDRYCIPIEECHRNARVLGKRSRHLIHRLGKGAGPIARRFFSRMCRGKPGEFLTWSDLRLLAQHPLVGIGAHGVHHCALKWMLPDTVREEVIYSKRRLEDELGQMVSEFSYPYGSVSRRVSEIVAQSGFRWAFTTEPAANPLSISEFNEPWRVGRSNLDSEITRWRERWYQRS